MGQIKNDLSNGTINPIFKSLSYININRKVMKIPVMTIPYNISIIGIKQKIIDTIVSHYVYEFKKLYYYFKLLNKKRLIRKIFSPINIIEPNVPNLYPVEPFFKSLIK